MRATSFPAVVTAMRFVAVMIQEKIGPLVIRVISSHRDDLVLRAESKESMNEWLFGFHRALASIIARYMENRGEGWQEERDWKAATQGGGGYDGADGTQRGALALLFPFPVMSRMYMYCHECRLLSAGNSRFGTPK